MRFREGWQNLLLVLVWELLLARAPNVHHSFRPLPHICSLKRAPLQRLLLPRWAKWVFLTQLYTISSASIFVCRKEPCLPVQLQTIIMLSLLCRFSWRELWSAHLTSASYASACLSVSCLHSPLPCQMCPLGSSKDSAKWHLGKGLEQGCGVELWGTLIVRGGRLPRGAGLYRGGGGSKERTGSEETGGVW